ncbi:MAG TPA: hypothetical protein VNM14_01135 [Planctomycetota bacterium]|nr:hypothetical protein [Planctomycetota bacterium]
MIAIVSFVVLVLVLLSFGERLTRLAGLRPGPLLERLSLSWTLSIGVVTLAVFGLAALHLVTRWSALLLVGMMALASLGPARDLFRELRGVAWGEILLRRSGWDRVLLALIGLFLAGGLVMALAPPTGMDTGIYHFTIPKVILQNHGLVPRSDIWIHKTGGFYMVYVLGMALGGEIVAKLLAFGMAVAGVGLAASVSERLRSGTGLAAMFIVLSTPLSAGYLGYEYLELPVLSYVLAAFLAVLRSSEGKVWTILACGLTGLALSTKPSAFATGILLPTALGLMLLRERQRGAVTVIASLALFALTAGFWSLWNYATTGMLVYRYPGTSLSASDEGGATLGPWWVGLIRQLGILATLGIYWTDSAGPMIVVGLIGVAVFLWRRESRIAVLLCAASVVGYLAVLVVLAPDYLFTGFGARYLAPSIVGFGGPAAAQFVGWVRERPGPLRTAVLLALLLPAAPLLVLKGGKAAVAAPAAVGLESRSAYLGKKVETFAACEVLNRLPDPNVKVLFAGVRPYYLDRPFVWIPYLGPNAFLGGVTTREEFVRRVREQGITHILHEPGGFRVAPFLESDGLSGPPFREIGRWPWKYDKTVRLYAVEPP